MVRAAEQGVEDGDSWIAPPLKLLEIIRNTPDSTKDI
jgi:hypothetical protein